MFPFIHRRSVSKRACWASHIEILRSNLASTVLNWKIGESTIWYDFDFMDPPAPETAMRALRSLNYLRCLSDGRRRMALGRLASQFPLDPMLAVMLIGSLLNVRRKYSPSLRYYSSFQCLKPASARKRADEAKMVFAHHPDRDHLTLLNYDGSGPTKLTR